MPKRVLVVDDHPAVALALKVFLRSDGRYEVSGRHLSLAAPLVHDGGSTGRVELEVDCGG